MFESLEATSIALWVGESLWAYPIMLSLHAVGLAAVVGIFGMLDLRLLGFFRGIRASSLLPLVKLAWVGFVVNTVSGVSLFTSQATAFVESVPFLIKIGLIFLGTISAAVIQSSLRNISDDDGGEGVSVTTKLFAAGSLALWTGAIISGRLIAYL